MKFLIVQLVIYAKENCKQEDEGTIAHYELKIFNFREKFESLTYF
jgi:hypothetical protein